METTLKKNQTADIPTKNGNKYSYQYVDIAQIHEYLENNNMRYYQYIDTCDVNGQDYIYTVPIVNDKELPARRGCRVVDATLMGVNNPAQQQGSAITYARRYSLLMAFGLATEDDDAQSLSTQKEYTLEQAKEYKLTFGKHTGKTLEEINNEAPDYIEWLVKNSKDEMILSFIEKLFNMKKSDYEVPEEKILITSEIMTLVAETEVDLQEVLDNYNLNSLNDADMKILTEIKNRLIKTKELRGKINE